MKGWCPIHLHDWPAGITSLPVFGALVNIEWNADLINKYYNWSNHWPNGYEQAIIHFMHQWRNFACKAEINLMEEAEIAFALEGIDLLEDLKILAAMKGLGLCSIQIAHIGSNRFFDKVLGLTEDGILLLNMMHELGIKLDLSHLHGEALYKIIKKFPGKRIVSHVVCESLLNWSLMHRSNAMSDEELCMCDAELYGVPFIDDSISPNASMKPNERNATVETIAKHILHLIEVVGLNRVALGPDYFNYQELETLYGVETSSIRSMDSISGLVMLEMYLKQSGLTEIEIEHVFWRNAKKFLQSHFVKG